MSEQFDDDNRRGHARGDPEMRNQIRQRVADAAEHRHQAADHAAQIGMSAAGQAAVVGEGFGEAHADGRAHRGRQPDQERRPVFRRVAKAAANSGASVDTEPSISPTSPG